MDFRKQKPTYLQIADRLMEQVLDGRLSEGGAMPSAGDVAMRMGVNPNIVVRTFDYLQQQEIIVDRPAAGYIVCMDAKKRILDIRRREFLQESLPLFRQQMKLLGIGIDDIELDDLV